MPVGHSLIALKSSARGWESWCSTRPRLHADLEAQWAVVAEAIQTVLRREGVEKPYELLKALTRGKAGIDAASIADFIAGLPVSEAVKARARRHHPAQLRRHDRGA